MTSPAKALLGRLVKSWSLALSCLTITLVAVVIGCAQEQIARVVNLRGDWFLNSSQKLGKGMPLPAGGIVQAHNPQDGDFIEIADRAGNIYQVVNCNRGCAGPIDIRATRGPGIVSRVFGAAMDLLRSHPERWTVLISKGGELREAVVKIVGQRVDLSTVLADQPRGHYVLRFEHVTSRVKSKPIGPVTVDWSPGESASILVKGLSPGLYVVQPLSSSDQKPLEPGSESMVLFVSPQTFDHASSAFNEAVALTKTWGDSVRHSSKRQFLRAALGVIASENR